MNKKNTWLILIVMTSMIGGSASVLSFSEVVILSLCLAFLSIIILKLYSKYN